MFQQFAGGVHNHDFDPGTQAGIETHGAFGAGGGSHQQALQVTGEDLYGFFFTELAYAAQQFGFQVGVELDLPGPAHHFLEPVIGGAALMAPAGYGGDHGFTGMRDGRFQLFWQHHGDVQDALVAATEQGQGPVAGDILQGFAVIEVVAEFGAVLLFAICQLGLNLCLVPEVGTQAGQ